MTVNDIQAPEGFFFKGSYTPGFGLVSMNLYQERKYFWGKRVASAYTILSLHESGIDAVNAVKTETLKRWKEREQLMAAEREVRDNL